MRWSGRNSLAAALLVYGTGFVRQRKLRNGCVSRYCGSAALAFFSVMLVLGLRVPVARADQPTFRVPAACDMGTFERALGRFLDRGEGEYMPGERVDVRVRARRGGFELSLVVRASDGRQARRTLRHVARCDVLLETAALVCAFVLDPVRAEQARSRVQPPVEADQLPVPVEGNRDETPPGGAETSTETDVNPAALGSSQSDALDPTAPSPLTATAGLTAPDDRVEERSPSSDRPSSEVAAERFSLVVLGGARSGLLGAVSPWFAAALELRFSPRGRITLRVDGTWPTRVQGPNAAAVEGGAVMMGSEACWEPWSAGRWSLASCVGAGAGVMRARGRGFDQNLSATRPIVYVGAAVDPRYVITSRVALRARLEACGWVVRPRFEVEPAAFRVTVPVASVGGTVGIEVRL